MGMPGHKSIASANMELLSRMDSTNCLLASVDPTRFCWACRYEYTRKYFPNRAHVDPVRNGGPNEPWNFFLLCDTCHKEQPDSSPRHIQEKWLATHPYWMSMYNDRMAPLVHALSSGLTKKQREDLAVELNEYFETLKKSPSVHSASRVEGKISGLLSRMVVFAEDWKSKRAAE